MRFDMSPLGLKTPFEIWRFYWFKAIMSFLYFALFNVLVLHFAEDCSLADSTAGCVSGAHGFFMGFVCLFGAVATDKIVCGYALIIGSALLAFGYGGMAYTTSS